VRVIVEFCGQLPGVVTSACVSVGFGSQASVAVGVAKLGVVEHWIDDGPGSEEIVGAVVSTTLITWLALVVLPQASVAVHVRVTVELCGQLPCVVTSANVSVGVPQLSVAVACAKTGVAGHWMLDGAGSCAIVGATVSFTGTVFESWLQHELAPQVVDVVLQAVRPRTTFPPQAAVTVNVMELVPWPAVIVPPLIVHA